MIKEEKNIHLYSQSPTQKIFEQKLIGQKNIFLIIL